jgi:hypothetical protein
MGLHIQMSPTLVANLVLVTTSAKPRSERFHIVNTNTLIS